MTVNSYADLAEHVEHDIVCTGYGYDNVVIECLDCNEILVSFDDEDTNVQWCPQCHAACRNGTTIDDHGRCIDCHKEALMS